VTRVSCLSLASCAGVREGSVACSPARRQRDRDAGREARTEVVRVGPVREELEQAVARAVLLMAF
jgi:hypothetical protein